MSGGPVERFRRVRKRQQVIEKGATMRRPGKMLGEACRLIAVAQRFQAGEMFAVDRLCGSDRQPDAMDGQGIAIAQCAELRVRRAARTHVVLGMDFDEADRLLAGKNVDEMLRLESDAGAVRETRRNGHQ